MHQLNVVFHVLATLAVVIAAGRVCGWVCRRFGQPEVIGEVLAGIALGPSLLGTWFPTAAGWLIPSAEIDPQRLVGRSLHTIAQLGIILYMFLVGIEFNLVELHRRARAAVVVSTSSIVVPLAVGLGLAWALSGWLGEPQVPVLHFSLFLGVAFSITAFPVLARILTDRRIERTAVGEIALASAALADVVAWCLLAMVIGLVQSRLQDGLIVSLWAGVFIAAMFLIARPVMGWVVAKLDSQPTPGGDAWLLVALLLSALATEAIGVHAVFGAFLFGAVIPHESRVAQLMTHKLREVVATLLLPAFFAITGMRTQVGLLADLEGWGGCLLIIAAAMASKVGGTYFAARYAGLDRATSVSLGLLMNTRGLMEIIVLDIGLDQGVISPRVFAMMVVMALATTLATGPLLSRVKPAAV